MRVALVCIAKNEDRYIEEWVDYHTKLGFDEIIVYQNDWTCNLERSNLKKIKKSGRHPQMDCYREYLRKVYATKEVDWVAFFDIDEFLVLKKHSNVKEFLKNYEDCLAVGINWYFFGNNNLTEPDYGAIRRFTKRQKKLNGHIKSILNVKNCAELNITMRTPHCIYEHEWSDTFKNKKAGAFNDKTTDEIAQLNHYFAKTIPEYQEKIDRHPCANRRSDLKRLYNGHLNEVDDFFAYNFMYGERPIESENESSIEPESENSIKTMNIVVTEEKKEDKDGLNVVQIGSNNGKDDAHKFIHNQDKINSLVFIDPLSNHNSTIKDQYNKFKNAFVENLAIVDDENLEEVTFYVFDRLSSLILDNVLKHNLDRSRIQEKKVKCSTINKIFEKYNLNCIDFLFIDTEGFDDKIIKSINFDKYLVKNIVYENLHINNQKIELFLEQQGYTVIKKVGENGWSNLATKFD